ncbi:MAG: protein kinase domain-containing protein [Methylosarcina sp.]
MHPSSLDIDILGYKIERLIAEGGMASVYLAQQESLGRPVALKLLRKFDNKSQATRFFNEGRIIASLNHHNIITIFDLGVVGERHYLAMEYLQGGDLRARIDAGMAASKVFELIENLGSCLSFVHRKGIIHRDIKPENILFRQDGSVVLTDFGVAKQMESNSALTMDGITLGSPYYLSPEQAQCKDLDGRADIYSLGIVCYEMLTGSKPFEGDSPLEIIISHLTSELPVLPPHLRYCQPLLLRMIAQNPSDRFATASELVDFVRQLRITVPKQKLFKIAKTSCETDKPPVAITKTLAENIICEDATLTHKTSRYWVGAAAGLTVMGPLTLFLWHQFLSEPTPEQFTHAQTVSPPPPIEQELKSTNQPVPLSQSSPAESSVPQASVQQPIPNAKAALHRAKAILKDKRLTLPKLKEAYDLYQIALKINRRHPEALRGVNIIANQFIAIKGDIERSLVLADAAIKSGKLNVPEPNSAAGYYRHILELEPGHPEALKGLDKLAGLFADRVEIHLSKSETAEAERNLRIGLGFKAEHPRLLALASRIKPSEDEGAQSLH